MRAVLCLLAASALVRSNELSGASELSELSELSVTTEPYEPYRPSRISDISGSETSEKSVTQHSASYLSGASEQSVTTEHDLSDLTVPSGISSELRNSEQGSNVSSSAEESGLNRTGVLTGPHETSEAGGSSGVSRDVSSESGLGPVECEAWGGDSDLKWFCGGPGLEYSVHGQPNDYARIVCTKGDLNPSRMPVLPLSSNGTFRVVSLEDCSLASTLASVLASVGASGVRALTLDAPRGRLTERWLAGAGDGIEKLMILNSEEQTRVPWGALASLPALKDFRLRGSNVTLEDHADDAQKLLRVTWLELALDRLHRLPRAALARAPAVRHLALWGNHLTNITSDAFEGLEELQELDLSRNQFTELPAGALASARRLRNLTLVAGRLRRVRTGALGGLDSLETVVFKFCAPLQLEARALGSLRALRRVEVDGCPLAALPGDLLHGSEALQELVIVKSSLTALPAGLFRDQGRLRALDLRGNRLTSLPGDVFWPLRALVNLTLDDNQIQELPDGLTSGLTELRSLSCNRNNLTRVAQNALRGAGGLRRLSLEDNQLTFEQVPFTGYAEPPSSGLASLTQLQELLLSRNRLRAVPGDWPWLLVQLKTLNLSHNHIEQLTQADLQFLGANMTIDLRHNRLSVVEVYDPPPGVAEQLPGPAPTNVLLLDDNPFTCDCDLYQFVRRLSGATRAVAAEPRLDPGDGRCASPPSLAGRPLATLPPAALSCPLRPHDCPPACECLMRPSTLALELDCPHELTEYPDPATFGLLQTHLRLRSVTDVAAFSVPAHVTVLNLTAAGLQETPALTALLHVRELDLTQNRLTSAPVQLLASNMTLRLANNSFTCDCSHWRGVAEMQKMADKILDSANVTCGGGESVWSVDAGRLCDVRTAVLAGSVLAALGVLVAVVSALVYRYSLEIKLFLFTRGWCGHVDEVDKDARYDAFVSFSQEDAQWVAEKLIPVLEQRYQYKLCVHYRDWVVGDMIPAQIARSVEESRRTIVVLSKSFLSSTWAMLEFRAANLRAQREKRARVLLVALDDAPSRQEMDAELRAYLDTNTYLQWGDAWFWEKLRYAMPHRRARVKRADIPRDTFDKTKRGGLDARLNADGMIVNAAFDYDKV